MICYRNGYEYTDAFGGSSSVGSLSPRLAKCLNSSIKNFILDGEMMPWDNKYKCFGTKGTIYSLIVDKYNIFFLIKILSFY